MIILGIETSCDETAIAVLEIAPRQARGEEIIVLSNVISSQVKLHAKYGGVVPNLAAREHEKNLPRVFNLALKKAGLVRNGMSGIDLIAVTRGPGLAPSLWRGINFAKDLSEKHNKPLVGVNHLEGHIYSNWLQPIAVSTKSQAPNHKQILNPKSPVGDLEKGRSPSGLYGLGSPLQDSNFSKKTFPILNLIVSGGHTELVLMKDHGKYKIIGETLDDAVGEAFDKVARLLGLGYPGGPHIAAEAAQYARTLTDKNSKTFLRQSASSRRYSAEELRFPRPMINSKNYDFSYAGLKTAVLYKVRDFKNAGVKITGRVKGEIAYQFQEAALDVLIQKTVKAAQEYKVKSLFLSGGVSANKELRERLRAGSKKLMINYSEPEMEYTGDNAAMIAAAGYLNYIKNTAFSKKGGSDSQKPTWNKVQMDANLGF